MEAVITIIASGDLRLEANQRCWPVQKKVEELVISAIERNEFRTERGHAYDSVKQHGFIDSPNMGCKYLPRQEPWIVRAVELESGAPGIESGILAANPLSTSTSSTQPSLSQCSDCLPGKLRLLNALASTVALHAE